MLLGPYKALSMFVFWAENDAKNIYDPHWGYIPCVWYLLIFLVTLRVQLGYTPKEDKIEIFCNRFRKTADLEEPTFKVSIFAILLEKLDRNITLVSCSNASGSITQSGADEKDLNDIGLRSPAMANQQACNTIQQQQSRLKYLINRDSLEGVQLHCYYQETLPVLKRNARAQLTILKLPGNGSSFVLFL